LPPDGFASGVFGDGLEVLARSYPGQVLLIHGHASSGRARRWWTAQRGSIRTASHAALDAVAAAASSGPFDASRLIMPSGLDRVMHEADRSNLFSERRSALVVSRAWYEYALACLVAFLLALLAACDAGADRSVADPGLYGGTLVVAGPADLDRANPLVTGDAYTQEVNRFLLFLPLVRYAPDLSIEPYLAESWTMQGDTSVTFVLRQDVRWHDGVPTTAEDVRFTIAAAMDPAVGYPNAGPFANWLGIEVLDSFTVRARFRAHADPLGTLALLPIAPAHLLSALPAAELGTAAFNGAPVGNGPFRFVSRQASDRWVFEANPDFPADLGGRPYLDRIVWRVIPERQAQLTELLTGNADLALSPPSDRFGESAEPGTHAVIRPSFKYAFIGWNGKRAPFGDARVRRALTLALDRAQMIQVLRAGQGTLATGPIHPDHWAYDAALAPLPFDPVAAKTQLAESGITDRDGDGTLDRPDGRAFGFDLEYQASSEFNRNLAELIQAQLSEIGIRVRPRPVDWNTLVSHVSSPERDFDAVVMGWEAEFRPDVRDLFHSAAMEGPFQLASYANAAVDTLIDRAATIVDREASLPVWHALQRILRDEQPWSFLYYYPDLLLANERLRGADMDLRGVFAAVQRWSVAAGAER
jgi:peptide/nickel transport system substrate-binding protein